MTRGSDREREERAADALLVSLLRRVDKSDEYIDPKHLPPLAEEDKAALASLGSDFVQRLLAGDRPVSVTDGPATECAPDREEPALAGAGADTSFNRAEAVDDATTEELDEREREVLRRKAERERKETGGAPPGTD